MFAPMSRLVRVYFVIQTDSHSSSVALALVAVKRRRYRGHKGGDHHHSSEKIIRKISKGCTPGSSHGRICKEAGSAESCGVRAAVMRSATYSARSIVQDGPRRCAQALRPAQRTEQLSR